MTSLTSMELFPVALSAFLDANCQTEEEAKAREKAMQRLRDLDYEGEMEMPAITQWLRPADEMYAPDE